MRKLLLGLVVSTLVALGLQAPAHASTGGTAGRSSCGFSRSYVTATTAIATTTTIPPATIA